MKKMAATVMALLVTSGMEAADAPATPANVFITLGTHGGPTSDRSRSEPANALVVGQAVYLVDAGDGAVQQLARAGYSLAAVRAVFISHIHIDHTGGLFAVLGLKHQMGGGGKITVYGPHGIKSMVNGLLAAIEPEARSAYGVPGEDYVAPESIVDVIELPDGAKVPFNGFTLTAVGNTHYGFPKDSDMARRYGSLSFRFDMANRSIVYTGDTGPSDAVTELARGADLLVSELIDPKVAESLPTAQKRSREMREHLIDHHINPDQVGEMAAKAKVKRVVITHLVAGRGPNVDTALYVAGVKKWFDGPVEIADDLDRY
jgi:ribonuclease BN (tRNA processing enzyme)